MDDALRIGLTFNAWPFSMPIAALDSDTRQLVIERALAIAPKPQRSVSSEEFDG